MVEVGTLSESSSRVESVSLNAIKLFYKTKVNRKLRGGAFEGPAFLFVRESF